MSNTSPPQPSPPDNSAPLHLPYLDGLRGLAALFVVFHHAYMEIHEEALSPFIQGVTGWLVNGQFAVDVFIILSGYCLMLPVVRSEGHLRGGIGQYLLRRARRILPPYYIALALSLLLIALVPCLSHPQGVRWDAALPAFTPGIIVSHLLVLHNLNSEWLVRIDPPMWSVATEWQIYFLFALLLLPVWRRFGNAVTVVVAFVVGLVPHFVFHTGDFACPWFLGLFSLGMVAASMTRYSPVTEARQIAWSWIGFALTLCLLFGAFATHFAENIENRYVTDTLAGIATACVLVACTAHSASEVKRHPAILRLMKSRFAVWLGTFSYSLYLVHFPILSLLHSGIRPFGLSAAKKFLLLGSVGVAISIAVSYLFFLLFERHFLSPAARRIEPVDGAQ